MTKPFQFWPADCFPSGCNNRDINPYTKVWKLKFYDSYEDAQIKYSPDTESIPPKRRHLIKTAKGGKWLAQLSIYEMKFYSEKPMPRKISAKREAANTACYWLTFRWIMEMAPPLPSEDPRPVCVIPA